MSLNSVKSFQVTYQKSDSGLASSRTIFNYLSMNNSVDASFNFDRSKELETNQLVKGVFVQSIESFSFSSLTPISELSLSLHQGFLYPWSGQEIGCAVWGGRGWMGKGSEKGKAAWHQGSQEMSLKKEHIRRWGTVRGLGSLHGPPRFMLSYLQITVLGWSLQHCS